MNKATFQRNCAMNYAILRTIVQDDNCLLNTITRKNIHELIDVRAFYTNYFIKDRFIQDNPIIFDLLTREAEIAFSKLRKGVRIIHRYAEDYPTSLHQDFKEQAPLFIYAFGNTALLNRKVKKIALVSTICHDIEYLNASQSVLHELIEHHSVVMVQNRSSLDQQMVELLDSQEVPYVLLDNAPILKKVEIDEGASFKDKCLLSFIGPMDGVMVEFQRLKIMNSLAGVTLLLSLYPNDVHHFSIQNNIAWHKPSMLPLIHEDDAQKFERVFFKNEHLSFMDCIKQIIN